MEKFRICRICGINSTHAAFKPNANICLPCYRAEIREHHSKNRDKLYKQTREWKIKNHDKNRETERKLYHTPEGKAKHVARSTKTPKVVLLKALSSIKSHFTKPTKHDPKIGDPRRAFDLDDQYILDLWNKQEGKCALTGVLLSLKRNDLTAISIDRIDSKKGHIKGNIQIVCQWVNYAKRHYSNSAMQDVLKQFYNVRKAEEDAEKAEE